jgi:chorismate mutase
MARPARRFVGGRSAKEEKALTRSRDFRPVYAGSTYSDRVPFRPSYPVSDTLRGAKPSAVPVLADPGGADTGAADTGAADTGAADTGAAGPRPAAARPVRLGAVTVGGAGAVTVAGPASGADVVWTSLRRRHGRADAAAELARIREELPRPLPLVVEPFSAADLPAIEAGADGLLVGAAWMQDFRLLSAVARTGLAVIIQRGPAATLEEWLSAAEYCRAEGNGNIVLCESGSRTHLPHATIDLALLRTARERAGLPVLADVSGAPELAVAALSVGADGLLLAEDATPAVAAEVGDRVVVLGPLLRPGSTDTLAAARTSIDQVDAALATLLERRAQLAGLVQGLKPVGGFAGRDARREREIVAAMARRAPRLGRDRIERIMDTVIAVGLEAAAADDAPEGAALRAPSGTRPPG